MGRKILRTALLALVLLGMQGFALAQVGKEVAEDLMHKCGMWAQLGSISNQMDTALLADAKRRGKPMSEQERQRLTVAIQTAYAPARLRSSALAGMQKSLDPALVDELSRWFNSPLGKTITALEEKSASTIEESGKLARRGAEAFTHASPARQELIKRIVQVSRAPEVAVDILIDAAIGIEQGIASTEPARVGPSFSEMSARLEKQRPQMLENYTGLITAEFTLTYASLNDAKLKRYAEFLSGEAGTRFTDITLRTFESTLSQAARDFGRGLTSAKDSSGA